MSWENPNLLLPRLKRYILQRGSSPLDHLLIGKGSWDIKMKRCDSFIPNNFFQDDKNFGDETFRIVYGKEFVIRRVSQVLV